MDRKHLLYGLVAAAAVALGVMAYLVFSGNSGSAVPQEGSKLNIALSPTDHTLGSPKAPVQFVEYAAPTCPHCAHWNAEVFPKFKKAYIDTGKVHYVFRVFPLSSVDAAVEAMARCLPKDSYFQFIDMMFRNQEKWDPDGYNVPDVHAALINMGRIAGMSARACRFVHLESGRTDQDRRGRRARQQGLWDQRHAQLHHQWRAEPERGDLAGASGRAQPPAPEAGQEIGKNPPASGHRRPALWTGPLDKSASARRAR